MIINDIFNDRAGSGEKWSGLAQKKAAELETGLWFRRWRAFIALKAALRKSRMEEIGHEIVRRRMKKVLQKWYGALATKMVVRRTRRKLEKMKVRVLFGKWKQQAKKGKRDKLARNHHGRRLMEKCWVVWQSGIVRGELNEDGCSFESQSPWIKRRRRAILVERILHKSWRKALLAAFRKWRLWATVARLLSSRKGRQYQSADLSSPMARLCST